MREKKFTRIAAFLLCLTMLLGSAVVFASASDAVNSEDSITGISQTWQDIVLVVQSFINRSYINFYIRMHFLYSLDTLWRSYETH